jgi:hypothetical protein
MASSDFEAIDALFSRISEKEQKHGFDLLSECEKTVLLIWHASGIIENGGFQHFYEQTLDAEAVAQAYERIGCGKCGDILRLSLSLFPGSLLHADPTERIDYIQRNSDMFYNLSNLFWEADIEMEKRLAEYIRSNYHHKNHSTENEEN